MSTARVQWMRTGLLALAAFALLAAGCETDDPPDTKGLSDYFEENPYESADRDNPVLRIVISPASVTLNTVGGVATFKVSGGTAPYAWSVANRSVGGIAPTRPNEALYTCRAVGENNVIVLDTAGRSAVATVNGTVTPGAALSVSPGAVTLNANGDRVSLTASGGTTPYAWSVADVAVGAIDRSSGSTVVYTRSRAGGNSVRVSDAAGASVTVVVSQP